MGITEIFRAIAEALKLTNKVEEEINTPEMKAAKLAKLERQEKDRINEEITNDDVEQTQKDLAN